MKVVIEIPDDEAAFAMKVLESLSFVKKSQTHNGGYWCTLERP